MCQSHLDIIALCSGVYPELEVGKVTKVPFSASDNQPYYDVRDKLIIYVPLIRVLRKHRRSDYRLAELMRTLVARQ